MCSTKPNRKRHHHCVRVAIVSTITALVCGICFVPVGCGGRDGPERAVVSGKVSYMGSPVARGEIRFVPTKGSTGPSAGGPIAEGVYRVEAQGGVPVGTLRVEIKAYRPATGVPPLPPGPLEGQIPDEEYLPDKYNVRSELELVIPPGSGAITQDYDLAE